MFCAKCGKELPDDAQFCIKCGHPLSATVLPTSPAPAPKREVKWGQVAAVLGALIVIVVIVVSLSTGAPSTSSNSSFRSTVPSVTVPRVMPSPHTQLIANGAITIRAASYSYYKFFVPSGATNAVVNGRFTATGGIGNDIEVYVLTEDGFVNFSNGHQTPTYYNSGKATQDSIRAVLPGSGTYYLVFNNNFSLITPKAVQLEAILQYTE